MKQSMLKPGTGRTARRKGFTLIELLVVITIITLLMALLVVLIKGVLDKARNSKSYALVKMLDMACQSYHKEFYVFPPYPPNNSAALHLHLGSSRVQRTQITRSTGNAAAAPSQYKPPMVSFKADMLDLQGGRTDLSPNPPLEIISAWGNKLLYINPGINNVKAVDLAFPGRDQIFETDINVTQTDDINNWLKDY